MNIAGKFGWIAILALPGISFGASFDCAKARSPAEVQICADPDLSKMDDDLSVLYRKARTVATDPAAFKKKNKEEWIWRERHCEDRACLVAWYESRSAQLSKIIDQAHASQPEVKSAPVEAEPSQPTTEGMQGTSARTGDDSSNWWIWIFGIGGFLWLIAKLKKPTVHSSPKNTPRPKSYVLATNSGFNQGSTHRPEDFDSRPNTAKAIPTKWIAAGQSVSVAGLTLPGGMLYVGSTLSASGGSPEPAQIDPRLPVDPNPPDLSERLTEYWPRYSSISSKARRAYLTWLASGRSDPSANIGYVFLFYYGLERRVLVDSSSNVSVKSEIPGIKREIDRLLSIYSNNSFQGYARQFLDFLDSDKFESQQYLQSAPPATNSAGLSLRLRIGLGQSAIDGNPVSAPWALAWIKSDPNIHRPTSATRCPEQFDAVFQRLYMARFGDGIRLPVNKTMLKLTYRPASGGLSSRSFTSATINLPDVSAVVAPVKKLQAIVTESAEALDAYSRFIGRNPEKAQSLEATLLLPVDLWPRAVKSAFDEIDKRIGSGMTVIKLGDLVGALGGSITLTRDRIKTLVQTLGVLRVGVEPDVLAGARTPKSDDSVVLFRLDPSDIGTGNQAGYEATAVMLDLATTLADADGEISAPEIRFLNDQIDAWTHVGASAQRRLRARLRLSIQAPPSLASLKAKLEPLPTAAKAALGKLLSTLAWADGVLAPAEVKHLEKTYKILGIEPDRLYSDLHAASAALGIIAPVNPGAAQTQRALPTSGTFTLDATRIAALQKDTEQVTALLSKVFEEETPPAPTAVHPVADSGIAEASGQSSLLGLDAEHSAFLRLLLSRPTWSRQELNDAAADMELLLDGALERINEAALDQFEIPVAEGDDPIEIAQDLKEKMAT